MMKAEARVFLGVTAFFVLIGVIYWFTSYEDAGAVMLAASAGDGRDRRWRDPAAVARRTGTARGRSRRHAGRGAGTVDVFPTQSIWPFAVGLSAAVAASGFAFGAWLVLIGTGASGRLAHLLDPRGAPRTTVPGEPPGHGDGESSSASST